MAFLFLLSRFFNVEYLYMDGRVNCPYLASRVTLPLYDDFLVGGLAHAEVLSLLGPTVNINTI